MQGSRIEKDDRECVEPSIEVRCLPNQPEAHNAGRDERSGENAANEPRRHSFTTVAETHHSRWLPSRS